MLSNSNRASTHENGCLSLETLNPLIKLSNFNIFGSVYKRAMEIEEELQKGKTWPFKEVMKFTFGDCHAVGQTPITFLRQVIALVSLPQLIDDHEFPQDAKDRAKQLIHACKGSIGAYPDVVGLELVRRHVADYINLRDGQPSDYKDIFLLAGATTSIIYILNMFRCEINNKKPGVMIPTPQYPLYSANLGYMDMYQIDYYLSEEEEWFIDIEELERSISSAESHCYPRVLVIINPGNPTGHVLTRKNMEVIIKFAYNHNLFILADEVCQDNVYDDKFNFISFKKVLLELGQPYNVNVQLASVMSISKGFISESGLRGGYVEFTNMDPEIKFMFFKSMSASEVPPVSGMVGLDCYVNPPKVSDESYEIYMKEKMHILSGLSERANFMANTLNSIHGISCSPIRGAIYAFPRISLPQRAFIEAKELGQDPSEFYALQLLENTGIALMPGSAFGQKPDTYHVRFSILPEKKRLESLMTSFKNFHDNFMEKYS